MQGILFNTFIKTRILAHLLCIYVLFFFFLYEKEAFHLTSKLELIYNRQLLFEK